MSVLDDAIDIYRNIAGKEKANLVIEELSCLRSDKREFYDAIDAYKIELAYLRTRIAELEAAENSARVILLCVANGLVGILENEGMDTQKFISNRDASIKWLVTYPEEQK